MASAFEAKLILSDFQKSVDLITQQRTKAFPVSFPNVKHGETFPQRKPSFYYKMT